MSLSSGAFPLKLVHWTLILPGKFNIKLKLSRCSAVRRPICALSCEEAQSAPGAKNMLHGHVCYILYNVIKGINPRLQETQDHVQTHYQLNMQAVWCKVGCVHEHNSISWGNSITRMVKFSPSIGGQDKSLHNTGASSHIAAPITAVAAPVTPTSTLGNQHRVNLFPTSGTSLAAFNQSQFNYCGSRGWGRVISQPHRPFYKTCYEGKKGRSMCLSHSTTHSRCPSKLQFSAIELFPPEITDYSDDNIRGSATTNNQVTLIHTNNPAYTVYI